MEPPNRDDEKDPREQVSLRSVEGYSSQIAPIAPQAPEQEPPASLEDINVLAPRLDELAEGTKTEEDDVFEQIAHRHTRRIGAILRKRGVAIDDRDDIVQEVLLRVWRSYDPKREASFSGWVYRITVNEANRHFGRQGALLDRTAKVSLEDAEDDPKLRTEADGGLSNDEPDVSTVLNEAERGLVQSRREGYTAREIAEQLGVSEGAVRARLHRLRVKLQKLYELQKLHDRKSNA